MADTRKLKRIVQQYGDCMEFKVDDEDKALAEGLDDVAAV